MAGDWIKMEQATGEKPEVLTIARMLGVSRRETIGILFDYWSWLDRNARHEVVRNLSRKCLDDVLHCPGFAACLEHVGWVQWDDNAGTATIVNYERHNGSSAKTRASDQKRKRTERGQNPDKNRTREEKRREEIKQIQPQAQQAAPSGVRPEVWDAWKKARGKKLTPDAVRLQTAFLVEQGGDPNAIIEQSIRNGWQGLFALRSTGPPAKHEARQKVANEIWGTRHEQPSERVIDGESERVA